MKLNFKGRIGKVTLYILLGFAVLFFFRLIYSFTSVTTDSEPDYISDFFSDGDGSRWKKNYASDSYNLKRDFEKGESVKASPSSTDAPQEYSVSQKYEKTATVKSRSREFDKDERKSKDLVREFSGIIQFEENSGNKGNRELHLLVGIQPEKFDAFYDAVIKIGKVKSKEITKTDKTNEYKALNAKKNSLEKIRTSLVELQKQSGKIDEYINLQNRILEIEEQLQDLGVSLGDFDEENEFCSVRFSLVEGREPVPMSNLHRLKISFEWTVTYYLQFLLIVVLATFSAFFILLIIDKLRIVTNIIRKLNE